MSRAADTRARLLDAAEALVMAHGFAATTVDAIIARAGVTKGAFFHHFASKAELGRALVERYAALDAAHLESAMARAERLATDPLQQMLLFVGLAIEELEGGPADALPGCLFASYCYEAQLFDETTHAAIRGAVQRWRERVGGKLREVVARHPPRRDVDPTSLADALWVAFEGAFVLARATGERGALAAQLRHYRSHLELLFGADAAAAGAGAPRETNAAPR